MIGLVFKKNQTPKIKLRWIHVPTKILESLIFYTYVHKYSQMQLIRLEKDRDKDSV